jgi:transcriptional regulator with XRE-family HTH domain
VQQTILQSASELGRQLKRLRTAHDLTLQSIAEQTGLSKSFLSMVESGARAPKPCDLRHILACYDYSLAWFVSQTLPASAETSDAASKTKRTTKHGTERSTKRDIKQSAAQTILTPHAQAILLQSSPQLLLRRPLRTRTDAEWLELTLPAKSEFTEPLTLQEAKRQVKQEVKGLEKGLKNGRGKARVKHDDAAQEIRGIILAGTLLLLLDGNEYVCRVGDEFCFTPSTAPHASHSSYSLRNHTAVPCVLALVVSFVHELSPMRR